MASGSYLTFCTVCEKPKCDHWPVKLTRKPVQFAYLHVDASVIARLASAKRDLKMIGDSRRVAAFTTDSYSSRCHDHVGETGRRGGMVLVVASEAVRLL